MIRLCLSTSLCILLIGSICMTRDQMINADDSEDIEDFPEAPEAEAEELEVADYTSAEPSDLDHVYFYDNFDDVDVSKKRWIVSRAQKEDTSGSKYDGTWEFQLPQRVIFGNDRALVLKSKAKHAAISAKLSRPFEFNKKPFFVQYEVNFQNGIDCGGAYIKLLSHSPNLDLAKFTDKTPYTIMFGPDKCGNDYKLHFILRHKNPITGEFEEKHANKPTTRLEENYSDKKPHSYLLKLFPDNTFQVHVDGVLVNNGHLLEDMTPAVNPPAEIPDPKDRKPADWDERENIVDPTAKKPEDWDEDAPAMIPDPSAVKPSGWLDEEELTLPDTAAKKPEDWDEGMDGEWEPPRVNNPACEGAEGCGPWSPPQIPNPEFKGKWKAPTIPNPNYKGKWSPRMIPNPEYFDDKEPFKMTPIGAIGIEIWAMTDLILFDNFIITDNEKVLQDWNTKTYDLKKRQIDKDSEGVFSRIFNYTNAHPWLWAVYIVVIALPLVLIISFCCGNNQEKRDEARHKKTDDYQEDDDEELVDDLPQREGSQKPQTSPKESPKRSTRKDDKEDLELDAGGMGDFQPIEDDDNEEEEEEEGESGLSDPAAAGSTESEDTDAEPEPALEQKASKPKRRAPRID